MNPTLSHTLRRALALALLVFAGSLPALAAEATRSFDLQPGDATQTLKAFAAQAGREIVFAPNAVASVKTNQVKGDLEPKAALDALLADTGLVATQDAKTGAFAVRKSPLPNAQRVAQTTTTPTSQSKSEDGSLILEKFEVTGHRVDGMINKSLLPTDIAAPIYHTVIDREEIARLGVTSIEELFRYVPQTSSGANALQSLPGNFNTNGGTQANISLVGLRGFAAGQTVILINGRLQPRSGVFSGSGADLGRIPIAAIERVEILPLSGSALYGAGAVGGAINVILRKDYAGRDLTTYVGTSTDGGATEYRATYLEGRTFKLFGRRTSATLTLDYNHRDPLLHSDRNYIDRVWDKYGPTTQLRDANGVSMFEVRTMRAFSGAPATLLVSAGPAAAINDLGIPGAPGVRYAAIPLGTTAAGSLTLTPDSFTATAGKFNRGNRFQRGVIYKPLDTFNVNLQLEHELVPDKLQLYTEMSYIDYRSRFSSPQFLSISLGATDPLNPFRTGVTPGFVGRGVTVFFDPVDIPDPSTLEKRNTGRLVLGLRGKLNEQWEWSVDGTMDYYHAYTSNNNTVSLLPSLQGANGFTGFGTDSVTGQPWVAAPQATRRAVYPLLSDHRQFPVPAGDLDTVWQEYLNSGNITRNYLGLARLSGSPLTLPAGPWNVSLVGEYTDYHRQAGQLSDSTDAMYTLLTGFPFRGNPPQANVFYDRKSQAAIFETTIPVFSPKWKPLLVEGLDLNLSARVQQDKSDYLVPPGLGFTPLDASDKKTSYTRVFAAKLQIVKDVAVRGSFTQGFYPPDFNDFAQPRSTFLNNQPVAPDPLRGNTSGPLFVYNVVQGGNPAIKPESSNSYSVGLLFTPRFLKGLSLTVDYWKIEKKNAITSVFYTNIILRPDDYPGRISRAPLTPADQALGYTAGEITGVDATIANIGITQTNGADVQLRYHHDLGAPGQLDFSANSSWTNEFSTQAFAGRPFIDTAGAGGPLHWRGRGSVSWTKKRMSATLTARYSGHFSTSTTAPTVAFPTAFPLDGGRIPAFMRYDLQFTYDWPTQAGRAAWRNLLSGTRWTVGCQNIFDDEPSMVTNGNSYYNTQDDPRQRFVYLSIKKTF